MEILEKQVKARARRLSSKPLDVGFQKLVIINLVEDQINPHRVVHHRNQSLVIKFSKSGTQSAMQTSRALIQFMQSSILSLLFVSFSIMLLGSGCSTSPGGFTTQTPHIETLQVHLPTRITEVTKPTSTTPVIATPTGFDDQSSKPTIEEVRGCEEDAESEIHNLGNSGAEYLVITRENDSTGSLWTLSIDDYQFTKIPDTEWAMSPSLNSDLARIVYTRFVNENEQLALLSLDDLSTNVLIESLEKGYNIAQWSGTHELTLFRTLDFEYKPRPLWPVQILNLQDQSITTLGTPSYDNRFAGIFLGSGNGIGVVVVEQPGKWMWGIYDIVQESMLASFTAQGFVRAVWSPDGSYVAISGEDLKIFDPNQMAEVLEIDLSPGIEANYFLEPLGWDRTSRKVAYAVFPPGLDPEHEPPMGIYIYDMETRISRHFCLDAGYAGGFNFFWSPSNRFVAWANIDPVETLILDVENGKLKRIPFISVIGWGMENAIP